jgi:RNA-binding protein YlmH
MNKEEILKNYKNEEDKLAVAKMLDKIEQANKRNKIENTDFVDERLIHILENVLTRTNIENYIVYGGFEEAQRNVIIFYPNKWNKDIVEKNLNSVMQIVRILLPKELQGRYTHRDYLGGLMKMGLKREKIGDILVWEEGADIIVLNEIVPFLQQHLDTLTRFQKCKITVECIENLHKVDINKEEIEIVVSSLRLDNVISELANTSRSKAEEFIRQERVFVNYEVASKDSKTVKIGDKITIRGKGKFEIKEQIRKHKKRQIYFKSRKVCVRTCNIRKK